MYKLLNFKNKSNILNIQILTCIQDNLILEYLIWYKSEYFKIDISIHCILSNIEYKF